MFGDFGENVFGDLEKNMFGDLEKNVFGDLEKTCSAKTLEIWRNMVGTVMGISFWSSSWSGVEPDDHKWRFKP